MPEPTPREPQAHHVEVIREFINVMHRSWHTGVSSCPCQSALAALDSLEAELNEWAHLVHRMEGSPGEHTPAMTRDYITDIIKEAIATEAELAEARELVEAVRADFSLAMPFVTGEHGSAAQRSWHARSRAFLSRHSPAGEPSDA